LTQHELEHFYYGQLARGGRPHGEARLLAYSGGVRPDDTLELVQQAALPPLDGVREGAWGLLRGRTFPFLLAQAGYGDAGQEMLHVVLMPSEVLRALGGNIDELMQLIDAPLPAYDRLGDRLPPLVLAADGPPEPQAQIDHILEMMTATRNRIDVIQALLAAVVQGVPVVVQGAPRDLAARVALVKGLLALLPPPARFGVTFATHALPATRLDAHIRFYSDDIPPAESLVYNWPGTHLAGRMAADDYSDFIISQLRLDAGMVLRRTQALTPIAQWRIRRGDKLADALAYAAKRLAIDESLLSNLPVEADDAARVLAEDPTLDDDLRPVYARHLLAFSLALDDTRPADPVVPLLRQHHDLAREALRYLEDALAAGKAGLVYSTLARWLALPLAPQDEAWRALAQRAALAHTEQLIQAGDVNAVREFLEDLHDAPEAVAISAVAAPMIESVLPLAARDRGLAVTIFLLAVNHADTDTLRRLLGSRRLLARLPKNLARLVPYLDGSSPAPAPAGLLADVCAGFGDQWEHLVLIRLAEITLLAGRSDLLDGPALAGLAAFAATPLGAHYEHALLWLVYNLSPDEMLKTREPDTSRYLLHILLARGAYTDLAREMLHQSRLLYPGDRQVDYALVVQKVFAETPISVQEVQAALRAIAQVGIRSLPLALAGLGALEGHGWPPALDNVAAEVTTVILNTPHVLEMVQPESLLSLLKFYTRQQNVAGAARAASLFPAVAAAHGGAGVELMTRMYSALDWADDLKLVRLELLRRYVRQAEPAAARQAISHFEALGRPVREALDATYSLKRLMGGVDFAGYAGFLHVTADLLEDTVLFYANRDRIPSATALLSSFQGLPGMLETEQYHTLAANMLALGRALVKLGEQHHAQAPRDAARHHSGLLAGSEDPVSGVDVLRVLGGYFAREKRYTLKLDRLVRSPFSHRSVNTLSDEVQVATNLLRSILQAFPPGKAVTLTTAAVRAEAESIWSSLDDAAQRELVRGLAVDFQRVADLALMVAEGGDRRAVEEKSGLGTKLDTLKHQPRSTLEFYRFAYAYFLSV
jgi:hypothetical protein